MSRIGQILAGLDDPARQRVEVVRLPLNVGDVDFDDLIADHLRADAALTEAMQHPDPDPAGLDELVAQVEATEAAMDAAKTEFRFASVGKAAWLDLVTSHPPTAAERKRDPRAEVSVSFQPAAVAASCVDPEMTVDDAKALMASLSDDLWDTLFSGALTANRGGGALPKSTLAGMIRRQSGRSATTAASEASPDQSSSD